MAAIPSLVTRFQNLILDVRDRKNELKDTITRFVEEESLEENIITTAEVFEEFIAMEAMSRNLSELLPCVKAVEDQAMNMLLVCELERVKNDSFVAHVTPYDLNVSKVTEEGDLKLAFFTDSRHPRDRNGLEKNPKSNGLIDSYRTITSVRFYHQYLSDHRYDVAKSTKYRLTEDREVDTLTGVFFFTKDMCHHVQVSNKPSRG